MSGKRPTVEISRGPTATSLARRVVPMLMVLSGAGMTFAGEVTFLNGDVLSGKIVERNDEAIVLEHPQMGRVEIPRSQLESVTPPRGQTGAGAMAAEAAMPGSSQPMPETTPETPPDGTPTEVARKEGTTDEPEKPSGLFGTRILRGWESTFGMGLTGSQGGFEDTKLSVLFETDIRNRDRSWEFDFNYFYNVAPKIDSQPERTTKDQGNATLRREWYFPDREKWTKWLMFGQGGWQYDAFQPWEHRLFFTGGPGYKLLDSEKWRLVPTLGLGAARTFSGSDQWAGEAMLGLELRWNPWDFVEFNTRNDFFLNLTNSQQYRSMQRLNVIFDISSGRGFGVRFSALFRHDTESEGKENDLTYLSAITYNF